MAVGEDGCLCLRRSAGLLRAITVWAKKTMTGEQWLRDSLQAHDVNDDFTEAVLSLRDQTRLSFCHRVGERWAKATGPEGQEAAGGAAAHVLTLIAMFRLNRKHLDIHFADGSRWELRFLEARPTEHRE